MPKRKWTKEYLAEIRELLDPGEKDLMMLIFADGESIEDAAETLEITPQEADRMKRQIKVAVAAWLAGKKEEERKRQKGKDAA